MARSRKPDIEFSSEFQEAYERLLTLADQLAAELTGDPLSSCGVPQTARSHALSMGMVYFLLRADPEDFRAVLFSEGSLNQVARRPSTEPHRGPAPFAGLL